MSIEAQLKQKEKEVKARFDQKKSQALMHERVMNNAKKEMMKALEELAGIRGEYKAILDLKKTLKK